MLVALILLVAFGLFGWPLTTKGASGRVLLAPVLGLSASIFLAYVISMNLHMPGADAMATAMAILTVAALASSIWRSRKMATIGYADFSREAQSALLPLLATIILFIPAMQYGLENFFGAVNFDFFYNSQDAWFLATNSVLDFNLRESLIIPLNWSANHQGRFAISLVGAFAFKYFGANPLHFHSALMFTLVLINALTTCVFAQRIFGLGIWLSGLAAATFILSGGFAQGYIYYLLGQISAIPVFVATCIYTYELLLKLGHNVSTRKRIWSEALVLIVLLNALYVFYTILSFFALGVITVASVLQSLKDKTYSPKIISRMLFVLVGTASAFLLVRIFSFAETKRAIVEWVVLSLKTAGKNSQAPAVFSEYLTESFLSLLFGVFRYPTNASIFNGLLGSGTSRSWLLLLTGVLALLVFMYCLLIFLRAKGPQYSGKVVFLAITAISLSSASLFFMSQSGYAIFKIGTWLMPLLLTVLIAAIWLPHQQARCWKISFICITFLLIGTNIISALNYSYAFLPNIGVQNYENSKNVNGLNGLNSLKNWLRNYPALPLIFDLTDGIKTAWVANEFRDRPVRALTHNTQPLTDRLVPTPSCSSKSEIWSSDAILVTDRRWKDNNDILSIYPEHYPIFQNDKYAAHLISKLDHYVFIGRGSYPPTTLTTEQVQKTGLPSTIRWIEKGIEIYVYSRRTGTVDIELDAVPGYVTGSLTRTIRLTGSELDRTAVFKKNAQRVNFDTVQIHEGMNCFFIESKDDVTPMTRYGALFRANVSQDFRFLNFALGNATVRFHNQ